MLEQAAREGGGVIIPRHVQKMCEHSTLGTQFPGCGGVGLIVGLDVLKTSLPNKHILWFYDPVVRLCS